MMKEKQRRKKLENLQKVQHQIWENQIETNYRRFEQIKREQDEAKNQISFSWMDQDWLNYIFSFFY